jgi:hypothetical protein
MVEDVARHLDIQLVNHSPVHVGDSERAERIGRGKPGARSGDSTGPHAD